MKTKMKILMCVLAALVLVLGIGASVHPESSDENSEIINIDENDVALSESAGDLNPEKTTEEAVIATEPAAEGSEADAEAAAPAAEETAEEPAAEEGEEPETEGEQTQEEADAEPTEETEISAVQGESTEGETAGEAGTGDPESPALTEEPAPVELKPEVRLIVREKENNIITLELWGYNFATNIGSVRVKYDSADVRPWNYKNKRALTAANPVSTMLYIGEAGRVEYTGATLAAYVGKGPMASIDLSNNILYMSYAVQFGAVDDGFLNENGQVEIGPEGRCLMRAYFQKVGDLDAETFKITAAEGVNPTGVCVQAGASILDDWITAAETVKIVLPAAETATLSISAEASAAAEAAGQVIDEPEEIEEPDEEEVVTPSDPTEQEEYTIESLGATIEGLGMPKNNG